MIAQQFVKRFLDGQKLMHKAASRFIPGYDQLPLKRRWWRRSLEVCRVTGMWPRDFNLLGPANEIRVLRTAADMAGDGRPNAAEPVGERAPHEDPIASALGKLIRDPQRSITEIAEEVGIDRRRLYEDARFSATVKAMKAVKQGGIPRGLKDSDGNLEAWE